MGDSRPKTKKLRNATPNINLPIINSSSNKFNWKTLSESNVYILKKLPEVSLKECSLNQLDRIAFNPKKDLIKKELIKQNSSTSLGKAKVHQNSRNFRHKPLAQQFPGNHHSGHHAGHHPGHHRSLTNQKLAVSIHCYLCNEQFNGKEIIKHEAECLERWRRLPSEEKRRAIEEQQRWLNDADSDVALSSEGDLNETADTLSDSHGQWKKFKAILRSCSKCGRNFFEHRLEKHEANCKGKQALNKLTEADTPQQQEAIVFVRKTKPLNSRSTQFYKQQQQASRSVGLGSPSGSPSGSASDGESDTNSAPPAAKPEESNGEEAAIENEKTNSSSQPKVSTTNYFAKCPQCGRVLNKSNLQRHERYHARSISLNQPAEEERASAQDGRTDRLSFNGLSLDGSSALSPVNAVDVTADRALNGNLDGTKEPVTKAELIIQLSKQFNPENSVANPANQSNQASLPNGSPDHQQQQQHNPTNSPTGEPLMFNEDEWSEHLAKLKTCNKCNRTFFADRIKKHQSICKAKKATV